MASKRHSLLLQCLVLLLYSCIDVCRGEYILRKQGEEIDTGPIYLVSPYNLKNWVSTKARAVPIEVTELWNPCDPAAYSSDLISAYLEMYNVTSQDPWIAFASPNTLRQDCAHFNIPSFKIDVAEIWVLQLQKVRATALVTPMFQGELHPIQPFLQYGGLDKAHGLLNEKIKIQIPTLIVTKDDYLHLWELVRQESNNLHSTAKLSIEIDGLNYNPLEPISQNSGSWRIISMLILASNLLGCGYGVLVLYSEREARKKAFKAKLTMATSDSIEAKEARNRRGSGLLLLGLTVQTIAFFIRGIVALDTLGCFGVIGFFMARVVFTLTIPMNTVTNTIAIFAWVDIARNALSSNKLPDLPVHDAVKKPFLRILVVAFLLSFVVVDVALSVLVVSGGAQQYANYIVAAIHVVNLIATTALGMVVSHRMRVIVEPLLTAEANKQFQERLNLAKNVDSSAIPSTIIQDREGRSPRKTSRSPSSASVVITPVKTTGGGSGKNAMRKNSDLKSTGTSQRGSEKRTSNHMRTSKVTPEVGEEGSKTPLKKSNSNLPGITEPSKGASAQPIESVQSATRVPDTSVSGGDEDVESSDFIDRPPQASDATTAGERVAPEADGDYTIQHAKELIESDGNEVAATSPSDGQLITKRKKTESQSYVQPPTPRRNKRKGTQGKQMRMSTTALAADEKEASKEGKSIRQPGAGLRASVGSFDSEAPARNLRGSVNIDLEGQGPSPLRNGRGSAAVQDLPVDEDTNDGGDALSLLMKGGSKVDMTEEKKTHAPHHRINKATMQKKTVQKRELQNQIRNRKVLHTMKKTARYIMRNAWVNFILIIMGLLVSLRMYTYSSIAFIIVQGVPQVCLVLCALIQIKVIKLSRQADVLIFDED